MQSLHWCIRVARPSRASGSWAALKLSRSYFLPPGGGGGGARTLPSFTSLPSSSSPPLCLSLSQMHSSNLSLCVRGSFFPVSFVSAFLLRFSLPLPPSLSAPERTPENLPERTWRGRCLPLPPSLSPLMLLSARGEGADGSKTGRTNSSLGAQDRRTAVSSRSPDSARAVRVWIPASQHAGHSHPASRA